MSNGQSCQCGQGHGACASEFQYAVKIVCGEIEECRQTYPNPPVAPGLYFTAINIHNPAKCQTAHFRWKVAVANPGEPGPVTPYQRTPVLEPDRALEIDCEQIMRALTPQQWQSPPQSPPPKFVKGYVVIESDVELDVVAVYTGTQGNHWPLNAFHTERVQPRCVPVCEDLILPLHTGFAGWQTVSPTVGAVATLAGPLPNVWSAPPFGSAWVGQTSNAGLTGGQGGAPGSYSFELCFDLCFGFAVQPFQIQFLADDAANVSLNGNYIGSATNGFATPATLTVPPQFFRAGRNCFRVDVNNAGNSNNPTGFALAGILRVVRGKCPCSPLPIATRTRVRSGFEAQEVDFTDGS